MFDNTIDDRLQNAVNHTRNLASEVRVAISTTGSYKRKKALHCLLDNFNLHCVLVGSVTGWTGDNSDLADHFLTLTRNIESCLKQYRFEDEVKRWSEATDLWERAVRFYVKRDPAPQPSTIKTLFS